MTLFSLGLAVAAPLCACQTLLPGYTMGERLFAFSASAFVLACKLASAL
jgi:hypothetical protein